MKQRKSLESKKKLHKRKEITKGNLFVKYKNVLSGVHTELYSGFIDKRITIRKYAIGQHIK